MKRADSYILAFNAGSSSFKFKLFDAVTLNMHQSGVVNFSNGKQLDWNIQGASNQIIDFKPSDKEQGLNPIEQVVFGIKLLLKGLSLMAIGHRIVQGGQEYMNPVLINSKVLNDFEKNVYLAPNHLKMEVDLIRKFSLAFPHVTQVACFDTCFHQHMPPNARYYPFPDKFRSQGLIRYGFHGLSYEYIMGKLAEQILHPARRKIIIAHLGNGASMTAVKDGVGVDTTMGLSPMGGLMMGNRPGDLDPGVPLFLMKQERMDHIQLEKFLNKNSGLTGMTGTNDVRILLHLENTDQNAREAISLFCYHCCKSIGALSAAMGGLDTLVFTGGIGANSAAVRERICHDLGFLGIILDTESNHNQKEIISAENSWVTVCAFETNEEQIIAQHTSHILYIKK